MENIDKNKELEYIAKFCNEADFYYQQAREQLRSLWTAYCFHQNLDVDTPVYDSTLLKIWEMHNVKESFNDFFISDVDTNKFTMFTWFMSEYLE
jgi:hypothetical protein